MKESLCWSCDRTGTGECSWDRGLEPVLGWVAEKRDYPASTRMKENYTYNVVKCPLYRWDRKFKRRDGFIRKVKVTEEMKATIVRLVLGGKTNREISVELGVSLSTVSKYKMKYMRSVIPDGL